MKRQRLGMHQAFQLHSAKAYCWWQALAIDVQCHLD